MNYLLYIGNYKNFRKMKKLIIVIFFINILMLSCGTKEETRTEFIIKNNSSHNAELTVYDAQMPNQNPKDVTFKLDNNSEISYYYVIEGENGPFNDYPLGATADSACVIFNDNLQIIYRNNDLNPRNILDISSWDEVIESDTYFKYIYIITNDDYNNAVEIE